MLLFEPVVFRIYKIYWSLFEIRIFQKYPNIPMHSPDNFRISDIRRQTEKAQELPLLSLGLYLEVSRVDGHSVLWNVRSQFF